MLNGFNTFEEYDYYLEQTEREELQADYERAYQESLRDQSCPYPAKPFHTWGSDDEDCHGPNTIAAAKDQVALVVLSALSGVVNKRVQFYPNLRRKWSLSKIHDHAMEKLQWFASDDSYAGGYGGNVDEMVRAIYTYSK